MMATPTLSLATTTTATHQNVSTNKSNNNNINNSSSKLNLLNNSKTNLNDSIIIKSNLVDGKVKPSSSSSSSPISSSSLNSQQSSTSTMPESRLRRHVIEEVNDDSIYTIYLKKITYTFNNVLNKHSQYNGNYVTRCDQVDYSSSATKDNSNNNNGTTNSMLSNNGSNGKWNDDQQSLQWETRQLRTIKAANIEHLVQYILLLTPNQQASHNRCFNKKKKNTSTGTGTNTGTSSAGGGGTSQKPDSDSDDDCSLESNYLMEERNNVAHAMHVLFATYRQFVYPWQLFTEIIRQKPFASVKQFNFILFYWLNNYPEDFWTPCQPSASAVGGGVGNGNGSGGNGGGSSLGSFESHHTSSSSSNNDRDLNDDESSSMYSEYASSSLSSGNNYTTVSSSSSSSGSTTTTFNSSSSSSLTQSPSSTTQFSPLTLADQLISMRHIDEEVKKHCLHLLDMKKENHHSSYNTLNHSSSIHKTISKSSSIIELDTKFIAQQLTAIDLENFLALKPYTLLSSVRSKTKIEIMIRNFNLLSRHVIVTILQHSTPHLITIHWIEIAHHLRKMRNFNSLKAIIAGLTNESIYRLKSTIWNKLPRSSLSTFTNLSSIVDDVNNQTLLRHTQLFIEGTSKVSLEESFGTVPYLGTFLTDITMINTRYENYIKLESGKKLINFEKCCKQYEVLMQMQLLQKNAIAALQQQQQQNHHLEPIYSLNHYLSLRSQSVPSIPRVARIFRNWFQMNESDLPSDRECYQISLGIETGKNKK